jgi:hypothetical protein
MSQNEKTPVASKAPAIPSPARRTNGSQAIPCTLPTIDDVDSAKTLTPVSTLSPTLRDESNPCSAFYCHPTTRYSFEVQKSETKPIIEVTAIDLEAWQGRNSSDENQRRKDCEIWPGKHTLRAQKRGTRKPGVIGRIQRLDRRTKTWLKVGIVVFIVAVGIAIGVGVSKAVGGGVWKSIAHRDAKIGNGSRR